MPHLQVTDSQRTFQVLSHMSRKPQLQGKKWQEKLQKSLQYFLGFCKPIACFFRHFKAVSFCKLVAYFFCNRDLNCVNGICGSEIFNSEFCTWKGHFRRNFANFFAKRFVILSFKSVNETYKRCFLLTRLFCQRCCSWLPKIFEKKLFSFWTLPNMVLFDWLENNENFIVGDVYNKIEWKSLKEIFAKVASH